MMQINIEDDVSDKVTVANLKDTLNYFTSIDTKTSSVFFWDEPEKEAKEVKKMIKALNRVISWYEWQQYPIDIILL